MADASADRYFLGPMGDSVAVPPVIASKKLHCTIEFLYVCEHIDTSFAISVDF